MISTDIWQEICKHLPIEDIHSILRLNKYINQIDKYIWEPLLRRDFTTAIKIDREVRKLIEDDYNYTSKEEYKLILDYEKNNNFVKALIFNAKLLSESIAILGYS